MGTPSSASSASRRRKWSQCGCALRALGEEQTSLRRRRDRLEPVRFEQREGLRRRMTSQERFELGQPELDGRPAAAADRRSRSASNGFFRVVAWLMQGFMGWVRDPVNSSRGRPTSWLPAFELRRPRRRLTALRLPQPSGPSGIG